LQMMRIGSENKPKLKRMWDELVTS
jgi:hypothetical protein